MDLNIKVIGSNIHTCVYDKRDDFGFPIVNFSLLNGDAPGLPSYRIYISQLVRFVRCCTIIFDSILKIFKSLQNYCHRVTDATSFEKFFRSFSELLSKFGAISYKIMYLKDSLTQSSPVIMSTI